MPYAILAERPAGMFVAIPSRERPGWRWATPLLFTVLCVAFLAQALVDDDAHRGLLNEWGP